MKIYNCPNCGKKAVNPLTKAMAGRLNSKGRICPHCKKHIVNGYGATIFHAIVSIIMIIVMVVTFLKALENEILIMIIAIFAGNLIPRIINAFFFKMELSMRKDVLK